MRSLTVLYDDHCALCRQLKGWLELQPVYLPLELVAAGSREARARFPSLNPEQTLSELTVISDEGGLYEGEDAFLMCLYALRDWRGWALSLACPGGRPVLRLGLWLLEWLRGGRACEGSCGVPRFQNPSAAPWWV